MVTDFKHVKSNKTVTMTIQKENLAYIADGKKYNPKMDNKVIDHKPH